MRTAEEIRNMEFQKSTVGGYKQADVEIFLDEVAGIIDTLTNERDALDNQVAALTKKVEEYHQSEGSIHTALLSAQRLADQTVEEATAKAASVTKEAETKARTLLADAKEQAESLIRSAEKKTSMQLNDAVVKTESMITAAHDSVARQQLYFDKLRVEVANFKAKMLPEFEAQVALISKLPDEVPFAPERAAEAAAFEVGKKPDFAAFAPSKNESKEQKDPAPVKEEKKAAPAVPVSAAKSEPVKAAPGQASVPAAASVAAPSAPAAVSSAPTPARVPPSVPAPPAAPKQLEDAPSAPRQAAFHAPADSPATTEPKLSGFKILIDEDEDEETSVPIGHLNFDGEEPEEEKTSRGFFRKRK